MTIAVDALLLAAKDLRIELRTRQVTTAAAALSAITLVIVGLAVGPDPDRIRQLAPGLTWIALLYSVVVVGDRLERIDRAQDAFSGLWLAVADRRAIFLGKVVSLTIVLAVLQLGLWGLAIVLLDVAPRLELVALLPIAGLTGLSAAAVGALVLALVATAEQRTLLLPVALLPLLVPTLVSGVNASAAAIDGRLDQAGGWLVLLLAEAALFVGLGLLTYEAAAAPE